MKDPLKLARKELLKCGARIMIAGERNTTFLLPNGSQWTVTRGTPLKVVREVITGAQASSIGLRGFRAAVEKSVGENTVTTSKHFLERFALMEKQKGITQAEVVETLLRPKQVFQGDHKQDMRAFVGDQIKVIAARRPDESIHLVTVAWVDEDDWVRFPRPESEK